ncbi:hypothetical protein OFM21_29805, partial [Escherichia coli]|nr:hypothetical protein [Escherichia coli]
IVMSARSVGDMSIVAMPSAFLTDLPGCVASEIAGTLCCDSVGAPVWLDLVNSYLRPVRPTDSSTSARFIGQV